MDHLIYQETPRVTFATNTFIDVPVILQFDDTPLISVVRELELGYMSEIPIHAADGTYLAKVRGTRVYATEEGREAGVEIRQRHRVWVCSVGKRTAFEIHQGEGAAFRMEAELYAPAGALVKVADSVAEVHSPSGEALRVGNVTMRGNTFQGCPIGVLLRSDGSIGICAR